MSEVLKLSSNLEDYLETIAALIEDRDHGHAHSTDIAQKMQVKKPSVTSALKALAREGLIEYEPYSPIKMTKRGTERAKVIKRRHRILKEFFTTVLNVDPAQADPIACRIEHVITKDIADRMNNLIETFKSCPGCQEHFKKHENTVTLNTLIPGQRARIIEVSPKLQSAKKFADLGIIEGAELTMQRAAPLGDPLIFKLKGSSLSFRKGEAECIRVIIID